MRYIRSGKLGFLHGHDTGRNGKIYANLSKGPGEVVNTWRVDIIFGPFGGIEGCATRYDFGPTIDFHQSLQSKRPHSLVVSPRYRNKFRVPYQLSMLRI
jgi:hypothetical protein